MASNEYTEKQLKVINGEMPIESMTGQGLYHFYKKAIANNDEKLAIKIKKQQEILKEELRQRESQRSTMRTKKITHNEPIVWKQPKSNEYTEHQKQIVRGEIPYEQANTKELISIHMKAHNIGDYELSERILALIIVRRAQSITKRKSNHETYNRLRKKIKSPSSSCNNDDKHDCLSLVEQGILQGIITIDECLESHLLHIIKISKKNKDEETLSLAEKLLLYKQHPETVYVVQDHKEAIDLLEELLQLPIRRPNTWFVDE